MLTMELEFKNNDMNQFCGLKVIKREFSVDRTPQQNGVAKSKNSNTTNIAARTMLSDSLLPILHFRAGSVSTAFMIQNKGSGPDWLFDIDLLTNSMNYKPVTAGNQTNKNAVADDAGKKTNEEPANEGERNGQKKKEGYANNTNRDSIVSPSVSTAGKSFTNDDDLPTDPLMPDLEDTGIFNGAYDDEDVGAEADLNNFETTMNVSPIPTTRIHTDHPKDQIIGDINSATQTRRMTKISKEHAMVSYIKKQRRTNHKDYQNCLFACFLSQIEPKKVTQALINSSWIEAMQDELLQFRLQKVWRLVDLPKGKHTIRTKWVYKNKKDERGILVRNKARLVTQGYT
ncbi:putative ribonuclease H-like domain-containing protein [Tanacetum coccineum]